MKFGTVFLALFLAGGVAAPALAAADVLSIDANLKFLDDNKKLCHDSNPQFRPLPCVQSL